LVIVSAKSCLGIILDTGSAGVSPARLASAWFGGQAEIVDESVTGGRGYLVGWLRAGLAGETPALPG
jgi:hypothetical protein